MSKLILLIILPIMIFASEQNAVNHNAEIQNKFEGLNLSTEQDIVEFNEAMDLFNEFEKQETGKSLISQIPDEYVHEFFNHRLMEKNACLRKPAMYAFAYKYGYYMHYAYKRFVEHMSKVIMPQPTFYKIDMQKDRLSFFEESVRGRMATLGILKLCDEIITGGSPFEFNGFRQHWWGVLRVYDVQSKNWMDPHVGAALSYLNGYYKNQITRKIDNPHNQNNTMQTISNVVPMHIDAAHDDNEMDQIIEHAMKKALDPDNLREAIYYTTHIDPEC